MRALASEAVGVKVVSMGVGPVSAFDVKEASAVGADIIAFNVRTAGAEVDNMLKAGGVNVMAHCVIYSLLDEVRMAAIADRHYHIAFLYVIKGRRVCCSGGIFCLTRWRAVSKRHV